MNAKRFAVQSLSQCAILLFAVATATAAVPPSRQELDRSVAQYVAPYVKYHAFSGVVLVGKGDDVLINKAFGNANYEFGVPNTPDTRFQAGSISKRFTFVVVMHLVREKKLALTDALFKWVPDFPSADKITVADLLDHHSGIQDSDKWRGIFRRNFTTADAVDAIKSEPLDSVPGQKYSYTTWNYAVLAHIIERVTGDSYANVVKKYVYDPAGMRDSGELSTTVVVPRLANGYMPGPFSDVLSVCGPEDTSWKTGGGASYSTTRDLMRFARAYTTTLLTNEERALWDTEDENTTLLDRNVLEANGSAPGANAIINYFPESELSVVVLSNNNSPVARTIARDVASMYFREKYTVPTVSLAPGKPFDARLLRGYALEGRDFTFEIRLHDGTPFVRWGQTRWEAMLPEGDDRWFLPLDFGHMTLRLDDTGQLVEGTMTTTWSRTPMKVIAR
ncbi:MAG: beta-lactamase family protein [Acidobacteria bacterium]|nr:beta-lactamase family protein [Acidobacteriota bacterium]MBV9476680.1 beta-lactamase family protein [Acidobacteriota bacterium]